MAEVSSQPARYKPVVFYMFGNSTYHEEALTTSVVDPYVSCAATSIWDESTRASDSEYAYVDLGQRHFQAHTSANLICRVKLLL